MTISELARTSTSRENLRTSFILDNSPRVRASPKQLHSKLVDASRSSACDLPILRRVHVSHWNIPLGVIERIKRLHAGTACAVVREE